MIQFYQLKNKPRKTFGIIVSTIFFFLISIFWAGGCLELQRATAVLLDGRLIFHGGLGRCFISVPTTLYLQDSQYSLDTVQTGTRSSLSFAYNLK
jgi:hypothetical protein